jgi:two-component system NtrC family sensor kinase
MAIIRGGCEVVRANQAFARLAGVAVADLPGLRCGNHAFGELPCPGGGEQHQETTELEVRRGERTWLLRSFPFEGDARVVVFKDVTHEREVTRRLVQAEKMGAVGQLAGGVAHEINNPLGGILAFSQLMKRDAGRTPADLEALDLIEESAMRCKRIVESLLKFSRRSKIEDRRSFDLSKCVEDAAVLFRAQIKNYPRARMEMHLEEGLPAVYGDPGQLGQVVLNLLHNGLQALPNGEGTLTVKTGRRDAHCFFEVDDTGCGIAADHLPRIFEPHFTTKPPGEGTGLGLSIAYRIVEDHGGHFVVESKVNEGSAFTVMIPVQPESPLL